MNKKNVFYNTDCIEGSKKYLQDNSIDLIISDPPFAIQGDKLDKHYNRKEEFVVDGYIEIPKEEYPSFSDSWIKECERVLRPGGCIYIVSGYTNLVDILNALKKTKLEEINHIIWKYNFGVFTSRKYVSSHYHIMFYQKTGGKRVFNTNCRFGSDERDENNGSLNYKDREDVWIINREYKPGEVKNKNELPKELLKKMIQYSSNPGDLVCDLFLGSFSTAKVAIGLNRFAVGFEKNTHSYNHQIKETNKVIPGSLIDTLRIPSKNNNINSGKSWSEEDKGKLISSYKKLLKKEGSKQKAIKVLCEEFGRGRFSILNIINMMEDKTSDSLFSKE